MVTKIINLRLVEKEEKEEKEEKSGQENQKNRLNRDRIEQDCNFQSEGFIDS